MASFHYIDMEWLLQQNKSDVETNYELRDIYHK